MNQNIIYFDIETIPSPVRQTREEVKVPSNYKKQETIDKYIDENIDKEWAKQSLDPRKGVVLCLGIALNDEPITILKGDEKEIFENLEKFLIDKGITKPLWVAHNAKFDLGFVYLRSLKYGTKTLTKELPKNIYSDKVYCTQMNMTPFDTREYTSFEKACNFFGVPTSKDEMNGSQVWEYYLDDRKEEIFRYCEKDVDRLRQLYKKMNIV